MRYNERPTSRERFRGPWAGLAMKYIAKLMGVDRFRVEYVLYKYGTAKNNSLTPEELGRIIFFEHLRRMCEDIKSDIEKSGNGRTVPSLIDRLSRYYIPTSGERAPIKRLY